MERTPVTSKSIRSLGFDQETGLGEVEFLNGSVYTVHGLAVETFNEMVAAESVGSYYARNVRNNYLHVKADPTQ